MQSFTNFLLTSRADTSSILEKSGDFFLTPARIFFGGRQVFVFHNKLMQISPQRSDVDVRYPFIQIALKIAAFILLPFAAVGAIIKLSCLKDVNFRTFCTQPIPEDAICHPKLYEMFQHIHSTAKFVTDTRKGKLRFDPLELTECSCAGSNAFHRFVSSRRNTLESGIVQQLAATKLDKTQPLHLLSMGSGGLMSEFLVIEKLIFAGFTIIQIDCVDPAGIDPAKVEKIRKFFEKYPGAQVEINAYNNIDEISKGKSDYSALLAIDYDTLCDEWIESNRFTSAQDLIKAYRRLDHQGFMGLGFSKEDTLFGTQMYTVVLSSGASLLQNFVEDLIQQLPQREKLSINIPNFRFAGASHILLFCLALALEKSNKNYREISLTFLKQKDAENLETFKVMVQTFFPTTTVTFNNFEESSPKCDLLFTGSLEEEFVTQTYLSLLNPHSLTYILYPEGKMLRQTDQNVNERITIK